MSIDEAIYDTVSVHVYKLHNVLPLLVTYFNSHR